MKLENKITHEDQYCAPRWDDHHFSIRIKNGRMIKLRLRLNEENNKAIHIKLHYDEGYTEVWADADSQRIKINQLVDLDFSDLPKLRNKIRTYIIFS